MHIVHTEADGGKGGQPLRIINESLGMIQRGHQVTILCRKPRRCTRWRVMPG
jgi:hypothetical protein